MRVANVVSVTSRRFLLQRPLGELLRSKLQQELTRARAGDFGPSDFGKGAAVNAAAGL
jgi:hypothetical protein